MLLAVINYNVANNAQKGKLHRRAGNTTLFAGGNDLLGIDYLAANHKQTRKANLRAYNLL